MHSSIDHRMELFVRQFGALPESAQRLRDWEAREHRAFWIRRLLGKGIGSYVIAYGHGDEWWTWCFERHLEGLAPGCNLEEWRVERYESSGASGIASFYFNVALESWIRKSSARPRGPSVRPLCSLLVVSLPEGISVTTG